MGDIVHFSQEQIAQLVPACNLIEHGNIHRERLSRFDSAEDYLRLRSRMDSGSQGDQFYDSLALIEREVTEESFAPNEYLDLIPTKNTLSLWQEKSKYYQSAVSGEAKVISTSADVNSIPRINRGTTEINEPTYLLAVGYEISMAQMQAPATSLQYMRDKTGECIEALDALINGHFLNEELNGHRGLFGDEAVPTISKSPAQAITEESDPKDDIAHATRLIGEHAEQVRGDRTLRPDTLALSLKTYNLCSEKLYRDSNVLHFIAQNSPYLRSVDDIKYIDLLDQYQVGGEDGFCSALSYRKDSKIVCANVFAPRQYTVSQMLFGRFVVFLARISNVQWKKPLGGRMFYWPKGS